MGNGAYFHYLEERCKNLEVNKNYFLEINKCNREVITNNHSATHLLHESLRRIVGEHVAQKGSLVNEKKLRFDYSSNEKLSKIQIYKIESLVNNTIRSNVKVEVKNANQKAINEGAIALFGEKYPEIVRVVQMINSSKNENVLSSVELCGGTHVESTGEIGVFKILSDTSVSSGVKKLRL